MRRLPRYAHRTPQLSATEGQCRRAAPWVEAEPTRYSNRIHAHLGMLFPARSATWAGGVTSFPGAGVEGGRFVAGQLLAGITVPKEAAAICRT
ncbi:hypothetical protein SAMN05444521_5766 [Streptomyces sp. 3214.6]|nr:hypothetical protein SAMN05444521_5766 [Streptomyces sp. 3214.6]